MNRLKQLYAVLICCMCGCKQPADPVSATPVVHCDSANTVLIPEDMKARFYFKEGTYWIYKNVTTGETDSMWVWKGGNDVSPTNPKVSQTGLNKCYEGFGFFVKNTAFANSNKYLFSMYTEFQPKDGFARNDELVQLIEVSVQNNYLGHYLLNNKGGVYEEYNATIHFIDSITVHANLYTDVLHLDYPGGTIQGLFNEAFYAKEIGMIKFERSADHSVWELIRYKINP